MSQPIGQTRILSALARYTIQNLPKTLLFIGDTGCGKKTVARYLASKLQLDFVELESSIKMEDIQDFLYSTLNTVYLIDLDRFSEKQQTQFLKFIEEPSKAVYTILTASSEAMVLPTIINRCIKYTFDSYTVEQLQEITGNSNLNPMTVEIFKTPGKLKNLTEASFKDILALANKVLYEVVQSLQKLLQKFFVSP